MCAIDSFCTEVSMGADGRERVCGNVLEHLQCGAGLKGVRDVLCRFSIDLVVAQTASESQKETSGGADTYILKRAREAHLMYCKVVFNLSISVMAMIPSAV